MAMQSGAVMVPEKVPAQWYAHQQQPPHHQMDEKDALLLWFRSEFAAANAMIDALCHHLRTVGDPGEYEGVIAAIQQRRCNWNPVLHMQQYFPVGDVVYSLQQVGWKRRQWAVGVEGSARAGSIGKVFRRGGRGYRGGFEGQNFGKGWNGKDQSNGHLKENGNINERVNIMEKENMEEKAEKKESDEKFEPNTFDTRKGLRPEASSQEDGSFTEDGSALVSTEKQKALDSPKTFVSWETHDGISANIAEGMKLFEDLFDSSEVSELITLVNEFRAAGRKGQLQGKSSILRLKRPMRGHGREVIQFGIPTADAPIEDDTLDGTPKDMKMEPIPESLQHTIEHLVTNQVISIKPDSCIIDIFNEGDHSQPNNWPQWFGRPVCLLFLTECEMSFGKVLTAYHPGDYRGALKLSLHPGAVLVMEGRSADYTKHAISSARKQRIIVTLIKSLPKKGDSNRFYIAPSPNHGRRQAPPSGVLPTPAARPQLPASNGIPPVFVPAPVATAMAFPPLVAPPLPPPAPATWPASPLQNSASRLILPGTGVFLPPQSSSSSPTHPNSGGATNNLPVESEKLDVEEHDAPCNGTVVEDPVAGEERRDLH